MNILVGDLPSPSPSLKDGIRKVSDKLSQSFGKLYPHRLELRTDTLGNPQSIRNLSVDVAILQVAQLYTQDTKMAGTNEGRQNGIFFATVAEVETNNLLGKPVKNVTIHIWNCDATIKGGTMPADQQFVAFQGESITNPAMLAIQLVGIVDQVGNITLPGDTSRMLTQPAAREKYIHFPEFATIYPINKISSK